MSEESISQAEIDALVGSVSSKQESGSPASDLSPLYEPLGQLVDDGGVALSELLGVPCKGRLVGLAMTTVKEAPEALRGPVVIARCGLMGALSSMLFYVVPTDLALKVVTKMYGGVAPPALNDAAMGALVDSVEQMTQAGLGRLSALMGSQVMAGPVEFVKARGLSEVMGAPGLEVMAATVDLSMAEEEGQYLLIFPQSITSVMAGAVGQAVDAQMTQLPSLDQPISLVQPARLPSAQPMQPAVGTPARGATPTAVRREVAAAAAAPYHPAVFADLAPQERREETRNMDLLMDVSLQVTVELGRTRRQIREVLTLGPGSVVELDKLAGEQVDVLINGKLIAKGEVVVIDENYGVRITDIKSPAERVASIK